MGLGKQISGFFEVSGGRAYALDMLPALKAGDMAGVRRFIRNHAHSPRFSVDVAEAVTDIFSDPAGYKNSAASLKLLFNHYVETFPVFSALEKQTDIPLETKLWVAYATNPADEVAEGLGIIMAEYIKYRMSTDAQGYQLNLNALLPKMDNDLSNKIKNDILNSIKTVQHRLVEYVAREGGALPLNRGAGFLSVANDLPGADLWTKKIESFSVRTRENMLQGTIKHYSPVYPS